MKNKKDFYSTKLFKITLAVFLSHFLTLFALSISKVSKTKKNKIIVKSLAFEKIIKATKPKTSTKKAFSHKKPKRPAKIQNAFAKDIEKCFQSLENKKKQTEPSAITLSVPEKIKNLKIQTVQSNEIINDPYELKLIKFLQDKLELPDFGTVKLKLSINDMGKITELIILQSKNSKNVQYLKNQLHSLIYPCFNCADKEEKTKNYIINFDNLE